MKEQTTTDQVNYPTKYVMCFNSTCTRADECTHHLATQHIRKDDVAGFAVYPTMKNKETCPYYKKIRTIRSAWGFDTIFKDAKQKDAPALRDCIKAYLGGNGQYYRYHHGQLLLTPEQQSWIIELFKEYGYTEGLQFDNYVETTDW